MIYDAIGNPLEYRNGWKCEWSRGHRLDKIENLGRNVNAEFKYDEGVIRTQKIVNGVQTDFITSDIKLLGQKTGENVLLWQVDGSGNTIGFNYNNIPYFYMKNLQGDIVGITDASGNIVAKYTYDSWGKLISIKDASDVDKTTDDTFIGYINPLRYRGYYYDSETGLYYLNARYYDPEVGRFISGDETLDGGYNLFEYCYNNPINFADYTGKVVVDCMKVLSFNPYEHGTPYNCLCWAMFPITGEYLVEDLPRRTDLQIAINDVLLLFRRKTNARIELLDHIPSSVELNDNQYFIAMRINPHSGDAHFLRSSFGNHPLVWTHKQWYGGPLLELVGIDPEDERAWYAHRTATLNDAAHTVVATTDDTEASYTGPTTYFRVTLPPPSPCIIA